VRTPCGGHRGTVKAAAFSHAGGWLATAGDDGTVRLLDLKVWDLNAGPAHRRTETPEWPSRQPITSLVFSADDSRLAAWALLQNTVLVWYITADASAAEPLSLPHGDGILAIALSPDGNRLAVANSYNLHLWNLAAADPRASSVFSSSPSSGFWSMRSARTDIGWQQGASILWCGCGI
jgi:WD40 repeat protein